MINLTRINGKPFVVNAEKIRTIESTPDTVVGLDGGEKIIVKEQVDDVVSRAIAYARSVRSLTG